MALEILNRMGLRWTLFLENFVHLFCEVSSLFNVANMRQVVSNQFFPVHGDAYHEQSVLSEIYTYIIIYIYVFNVLQVF